MERYCRKLAIISGMIVNEWAMPVRRQKPSAIGLSATRIIQPYIPAANTQIYLPSKQQNPSGCILYANIRMKQMERLVSQLFQGKNGWMKILRFTDLEIEVI